MPHLWPTGSSSGSPPSITARHFSSCPSDSTSRWTPCPPGVSSGGSRQVLVCFQLSPSCPFRPFHTLHSPGQRGITPAFGYGAPHSSAGGTLTLLSNTLLSTHYESVRPSAPLRYSRLAVLAAWASPFASERLVPAVPCNRLHPLHAFSTPVATRSVIRPPAGSSQARIPLLVSTTLDFLTTRPR